MGRFLNPGNEGFSSSVRSRIYVDKTELVDFMNSVFDTEDKLVCVSRPRRFGKSMAAKMLVAYYSCGCDSYELFENLKIANTRSFIGRLNKYDVIYIDVQWFRSIAISKGDVSRTVSNIQSAVNDELCIQYADIQLKKDDPLPETMAKMKEATGRKFVVIIDEWDCLFREEKDNKLIQDEYINFLRGMFKGAHTEESIALAYMTGILPIKKYGTQSALNNFNEYTMVKPGNLAKYAGFTEEEVSELCEQYHMDFDEAKFWYDGYHFSKAKSVYSPNSVVKAMFNKEYGSYWTETETYEALRLYIDMDFDGLKDAIIMMLAGGRCKINPHKFQNDMTSVKSKDDVMTLLVHLGYLAYDSDKKEVFIPNQEVAGEFENAIEDGGWEEIVDAMKASDELLVATISGDVEAVVLRIDEIHMMNISVLAYNSELSLSYVIMIAYYSARKDYTLIRELPTGKGFADIVFLPRKHTDKPAIIVELKWNKSVEGAINQIKERKYMKILEDYKGELLLVGINYDKATKTHDCVIEKYMK